MKLIDIRNYGRYGSKHKKAHSCILDHYGIDVPRCYITEMIYLGDLATVVYAGNYNSYARIITDLEKFDEFKSVPYCSTICARCQFGCEHYCKCCKFEGLI